MLDILSLYPQASIFSLVYSPQKAAWLPTKFPITTSFINQLPFSSSNSVIYTPIYDIALEQFDLRAFDIVISTTSVLGHCLLTLPKTLFVCYFHNINRHLYFPSRKYSLLHPLLKKFQKIDYVYSRRPDHLLCNSLTVQKRIQDYYHLPADIIYPGVNLAHFTPSPTPKSDYFLTVSRLVPHKKIDLVIKTFNQLTDKLYIVGVGREYSKLRLLATGNNIKFLGNVSDKQLLNLYQNCKALICPQVEDFGLTMLEAQACGKPVIAFNQGGAQETIINSVTGLLFPEQDMNCLKQTINKFNRHRFFAASCRSQAQKFSQKNFMINFKKTISNLWQKHQNTSC